MTHATFVFGGYAVVFGTIALYAASVLVRGRRASRSVPPDQRRWLDS